MNYHDRPELNYSRLKVLAESPRIFEAQFITKTREQAKSKSLDIGTLLHAGLLENNIDDICAVLPSDIPRRDRRIKAYAAFEDANEGKLIVKAETRLEVMRAVESVRQNPTLKAIFSESPIYESPITWGHPSGLSVRAKPDIVLPTKRICADVKTCQCVDEYEFAKSIRTYYYDLQAAMYLDGCNAVYGDGEWNWIWIAIETEPPYRMRVYVLDADDRLNAEALYHRLVNEYVVRSKSNDWSDPEENQILPIRTLRRFEK